MVETIRKETVGKVPGKRTFVLSDATVDRYGDIIEPAGWQLANFQRNPIALFGHSSGFPIGTWSSVRVEKGQLIGDLEPAAAGTSQRVDEIISLIDQDILRATSVGFLPLEAGEPLNPKDPWGGLRYTSQELLEASIVSVPANPAALAVAKELNVSRETLSIAFGGLASTRSIVPTGRHASIPSPALQRGPPMLISQEIEQAQTRLNQRQDALSAFIAEPERDPAELARLNQEVEAVLAELTGLQRSERNLAPPNLLVGPGAAPPPPAPTVMRRPLGMQLREKKPKDILLGAGIAHLNAFVTRRSMDDVVRELFPDHEGTQFFAKMTIPGAMQKAAVAGATTTAAGWVAELIHIGYSGFVDLLDPQSIFPRVSQMGLSLPFGQGAGQIKIPGRAAGPTIGGAFVGEGQPIPVRRFGTTSITLSPHKMAVLTAYSRETALYATPSIQPLLEDAIRRDTSIVADTLFIDNVAADIIRPAGVLNGVTPITAATGGGYAAILKDITALAAAFYAQNAGARLALLMNPREGLLMNNTPGPGSGQFGWTNNITSRFTVLESTTIPAGVLIMIETADLVSAAGVPEFDASEYATLHMEDTTPLNIGTAGTPPTVAAPTQSMFQTAQVALRMIVPLTWAMRRTGMVQTISGANWAMP